MKVTIIIKVGRKTRTASRVFSKDEASKIGFVRQCMTDRTHEIANIARQGKFPSETRRRGLH